MYKWFIQQADKKKGRKKGRKKERKKDEKKEGKKRETVLCTYHFKTLMLWACEERPEEFWSENSLADSVRSLLIQMTE